MTLLQMSYILEVDRCGSMNRAARNLFLSQSALSAAIAEVERELGVTIFLRTNRGVTLTEEGRELTAQIAPLVERSRKLERYYSERRLPTGYPCRWHHSAIPSAPRHSWSSCTCWTSRISR